MRMNRLGETLTELEKKQMKTIDNLQEKIKLLEFDKSRDNQKIKNLEVFLERRNKILENLAIELENIRTNEDYKRLLVIIKFLKRMTKEPEYTEEELYIDIIK